MTGYEKHWLKKAGVISPIYAWFCISSHHSIVPKKKDLPTHEVSCRKVVDFKKINEIPEYWSHTSKLHGAKSFSTLDVRSGFYITVAKDSWKYTAFKTETGKFKLLKWVAFRIQVVSRNFTMMIHETLKGLDFWFTYLDNTILYSNVGKEHLDHLYQVFDCLLKANIKLKND